MAYLSDVLSSRAKNSISEMTNGSEYISPVRSPEMIGNRKGFGVGGTWLQLMCCTVSHRCVPNFKRQGSFGDRRSEVGDVFVVRQSQTRTSRKRSQVVEQEEDLRE